LLDAYLSERRLPPKSEAEFRAAWRRFGAVVGGGDKLAKDVSKADCRAYKASLLAAPSNRSMAKDGKLSPASVKKLLGICSTVHSPTGLHKGISIPTPSRASRALLVGTLRASSPDYPMTAQTSPLSLPRLRSA